MNDHVETVRLTTTQRWALGLILTAVGAMWAGFFAMYTKNQQDTAKQMAGLSTQIAVLNGSVESLSTQLADVPAIRREQAAIKEHQRDIDRRVTNLEQHR